MKDAVNYETDNVAVSILSDKTFKSVMIAVLNDANFKSFTALMSFKKSFNWAEEKENQIKKLIQKKYKEEKKEREADW